MTDVVVIGFNSFHNRGVEALSVSICEQILERNPETKITVLCKDVEYNQQKTPGLPVRYRTDAYREFVAKSCYVLGVLFTPIPRLLSREFREVRKLVRSADIVISSGGDNFGRDYGPFQNHLTPLMEANKANRHTVFLGQSIGPFKNSRATKLFKRVAQNCTFTTCRESRSYQFCVEELGLPEAKTALVGDVAFLLKPEGKERAEHILQEEGLKQGKPRIVLSISGGISKFSNSSRERHIERWVGIIRQILEALDASVIIVPHVWQNTQSKSNNDMTASLEIVEQVGSRDVVLVKEDLNAKEYKGIIGTADFVVAERMHAAIAGLSQCIPTVPISYSVKADGIIQDLFSGMPETERPIISIADLLEDENVAQRIVQLYKKRQQIREVLAKSLPQMIERAKANFQLLSQLI
jgi:colanic acid/amylovoran biosynthesis protein